MLDVICKELGVDIGEEFTAKQQGGCNQIFKLDKMHGFQVYNSTANQWVGAGSHIYKQLILGELKPSYIPQNGDKYCVPTLAIEGYNWFHWEGINDPIDKWYFDNNMIFKTKEEAIECANKMLNRK